MIIPSASRCGLVRLTSSSPAAPPRGAATSSGSRVLRELDADVLRLGEEAHRLLAPLATDAALLHAAERHAQVAEEPAVDPDGAGVDALRHPVGSRQVLGLDDRRQPV